MAQQSAHPAAHQHPAPRRYGSASRLLPIEAARLAVRAVTCAPGEQGCLRAVSLDVERGELLSLVGPAGSGKSLLLRVVAGLQQPDAGSVYLDGADVTDTPPGRRAVRLAFPGAALPGHRPIRELLAPTSGLLFWRDRSDEALLRARLELIAPELLPHLGARYGRLPPELQVQTNVAWALLRRPRVLLLDDPLVRLDQPLRGQVARHLRQLLEALGVTAVYATLDQAEGLALGHRTAVLNGGELEQVGSAQGLQALPRNLFVATWVHHGGLNLYTLRVDGTGEAARLVGPGLVVPLAAPWSDRLRGRPEVVVAVRPERLRVGEPEAGALYRAHVRAIEPLLWERRKRLHLTGPAGEQVALAPLEHLAYPGMPVGATFDLADALLFDPTTGLAIR